MTGATDQAAQTHGSSLLCVITFYPDLPAGLRYQPEAAGGLEVAGRLP